MQEFGVSTDEVVRRLLVASSIVAEVAVLVDLG